MVVGALMPRPRTLLNMAVCEKALGQSQKAFEHFEAFISSAEERDEELLPDALAGLREVARSLPPGQLQVTSSPPGAAVYLDDESNPRERRC